MEPATDRATQDLIVSLRKTSERDFHDLSMALLEKDVHEIISIARQLGIEDQGPNSWRKTAQASGDPKVLEKLRMSYVMDVRQWILNASSYRYVKGQLEVLPDGSGFLRNVQLAREAPYAQSYDNYDVYVSRTIIDFFRLRPGEIVSGLRRWPYPGETCLVLIEGLPIEREPPAMGQASSSAGTPAQRHG
jgi:transcription termination factor Rho